jgi:hypothetical protein
MSRPETFKYEGLSVRQEYGVKAVAQSSEGNVQELAEFAEKCARIGRIGTVGALRFVYELAAVIMADEGARQRFRESRIEVKLWKTSSKLTNFLVRELLGVSRQQASKCSAIIKDAFDKHIAADDIPKFIMRHGGIEKYYLMIVSVRKLGTSATVLTDPDDGAEAVGDGSHESQGGGRQAAKQRAAAITKSHGVASTSADESSAEESGFGDGLEVDARIEDKTIMLPAQLDDWARKLSSVLSRRIGDAKVDGQSKLLTVVFEVAPTGQIKVQGFVLGGID